MTSFQLKESANGVFYLVCAPLRDAGFLHAFSTRIGGVSAMPKDDLHLAYRDDDPKNVDENRRRFLSALGEKRPIVTAHQTHSTAAEFLSQTHDAQGPELDGDALGTSRADILLGIKTADCVPILIGDPLSGVIAAVHAGWRGTLGRIVAKTIGELRSKHGFNPATALAAIGPAACVDCYEIGAEVMASFQTEFAYASQLFRKNHLDVPLANRRQLEESGFSPTNIYIAQYCTMRDARLFFSHRRDGGHSRSTGRMLAVIGKKQ